MELRPLVPKVKLLEAGIARLDKLYQHAVANSWDARWKEREDEMDARMNETIRLTLKQIPPGEHDYMLKQVMTLTKRAERLQDDLREARAALDAQKRRCKCKG